MAADLATLLDPSHTAVVTSEVQRGVVGDRSRLPELAAAAKDAVEATGRLCAAARAAGAWVVHCVFARRADGAGTNTNARLFGAMAKMPPMLPGSEDAEVVPEIGVAESDIVLQRMHGLSPMAGTDLDAVLRNLGVRTVVPAGVSVNVAITNLVFDAVNAGYEVVIARDAVAGVPAEYAEQVMANTLGVLGTFTTVQAMEALWQPRH